MDMMAAILTMIGTGVAIIGFVYGFLRNFKSDINFRIDRLDTRMDRLDARMDQLDARMDRLDTRMDRLENKIESVQHTMNDIDKRLYGVEMVLHMKDCCVLKQDQNLKKAE